MWGMIEREDEVFYSYFLPFMSLLVVLDIQYWGWLDQIVFKRMGLLVKEIMRTW